MQLGDLRVPNGVAVSWWLGLDHLKAFSLAWLASGLGCRSRTSHSRHMPPSVWLSWAFSRHGSPSHNYQTSAMVPSLRNECSKKHWSKRKAFHSLTSKVTQALPFHSIDQIKRAEQRLYSSVEKKTDVYGKEQNQWWISRKQTPITPAPKIPLRIQISKIKVPGEKAPQISHMQPPKHPQN